MKLGEKYYSLAEHIRNIIITIVLLVITLLVAGVKIGCTEKIDARCVGHHYDYVQDKEYHSGHILDTTDKDVVIRGIYRYDINNQTYEWTDNTAFGYKNPVENNFYRILVNPNNPDKATILNIPSLVIGLLFTLLIVYGTVWSIMSNIVYIKKGGKKPEKQKIKNIYIEKEK